MIITFLMALVVIGLIWLGVMEVRLHSLKGVGARAEEAIAYAEGLLRRAHLHVDSPPPPATTQVAKKAKK